MTSENPNWLNERAELERNLIDAKQTVMKYEGALSPYERTVSDSEYRQARSDVMSYYTQIQNGDHESGKPSDPYGGMTVSQLKELYTEKSEAYEGGAGSGRQAAELMRIDTLIQQANNTKGDE
ncbi:hypothetical protein [Virgibacillus salexigens]|uniref:Uncharacterized protein n=2 Tax=Virgibacillus massiliensis TaxID=1462526 RepID=A0A024Q9X6_9BACI|nr:hypothetical protein [Virgibacillus massiliensis]CDQ39067.1 hypothetical protein BN990_01349 [Virgibacillus massiliensis]